MHKETVRKKAESGTDKTPVGLGGTPRKRTTAEIGAITKGSGDTKENKTTSTSLPDQPVPRPFLEKLGEMRTAEKELTLALPLIIKAAKSKDLKTLLKLHLTETKAHVEAIDAVAESLGEELPAKGCKPMTQLITEGVKVIGKRLVSSEQDSSLIAVGQKIEQFEISSYTALISEATKLECTHEVALLTSILNQENLASELLDALAAGKGPINELIEKASLRHAGATST